MRLARILTFLVLVGLAVGTVSASTGGLIIKVTDTEGNPLPGATVKLSSAEKQVKDTASITDKRGTVEFPVLRAGGGYILEVTFPGMRATKLENQRVKLGERTMIPIQLAEEFTEKITVQADRPVVELTESSTATKFSDDFIQDPPAAGRAYQNILTLAPGVQDADGDGNPNVHGSRARDFKAIVSGVSNVDPLTGQRSGDVNMDSIEEMEVIAAGAGVEFGGAQGGFAQIIQKQGGNTFEGVFNFLYSSSDLDGTGALDLPDDRAPQFESLRPSIQVSGPLIKDRLWYRLSHEIVDQELPVNTVGALNVVTIDRQINSDQITWQVSDRNKLIFRFDGNPSETRNFGVSSTQPPEASLFLENLNDVYSVEWTAPYSPQIFVTSQVSWLDGGFRLGPTTSGVPNNCFGVGPGAEFLAGAQCTNLETQETSGSFWRIFDDARQRFAASSDATIYAKKRWLGVSHEFRTGISIENERYVRELTENASAAFFSREPIDPNTGVNLDRVGTVFAQISVPETDRARATGTRWSFFLRDQMRVAQNLTIEVGARIEREVINAEGRSPFDPQAEYDNYVNLINSGVVATTARVQSFTAFEGNDAFVNQLAGILGIPQQQVASFFGPSTNASNQQAVRRRPQDINIENTNISPFLGITWDPWSNGKTKFAVTGRRFFQNLPLLVATRELAPTRATIGLDAPFVTNAAAEGINCPGGQTSCFAVNAIQDVRSTINPAATVNFTDRNLQTPYNDEFTLSFERQLFAETSMKISYVRREFRNQLQDIDANNISGDFGTCLDTTQPGDPVIDFTTGPDGIVDDCTGDFVEPADPNGTGATSGDLVARRNIIERPDGVPDLYKLNPFWNSVIVLGNFNQADYEGLVFELIRRQYRGWELSGSYTWSIAEGNGEDFNQILGNDAATIDDEFGFQSFDQRHVVKVNATTQTPWGVRLGTAITWQSGLPYSLLTQRLSFDTIAPDPSAPDLISTLGTQEGRTRFQYPSGVRNDQRNRPFWNFDFKATKEFRLGRGLNGSVSLDVFNALNDGTYQVYNPDLESGFQVNGINQARRRFGRRYQLSAKLSF